MNSNTSIIKTLYLAILVVDKDAKSHNWSNTNVTYG